MHVDFSSDSVVTGAAVRRVLGVLLLGAALLATPGCLVTEPDLSEFPNPRERGSWVHDGAQIIRDRQGDINRVLDDLEGTRGDEVAVVTVFSIGDMIPEEFAIALFERWDLGKEGRDNGVLVLHVVDQESVEVIRGSGVDGVLTDERTDAILDQVTDSFFRRESFADGHYETVRAIDRCLRTDGATGDLTDGWERQPGIVRQLPWRVPPVRLVTTLALPTSPVGYLLVAAVFFWMLGLYLTRRRRRSKWALAAHEKSARFEYAAACVGGFLLATDVLGVFVALCVSIPLAVVSVFLLRFATTRARPDVHRTCSACGADLYQTLSEDEEDQFLNEGQRAEEEVGGFDYEVWACRCGHMSVERGGSWGDVASCPSCSHKALSSETRILREPTYANLGRARFTIWCALCEYHEVAERNLDRLG